MSISSFNYTVHPLRYSSVLSTLKDIKIYNNKIYQLFAASDVNGSRQIFLGICNLDGSGWVKQQITNMPVYPSNETYIWPEYFDIQNDVIYFFGCMYHHESGYPVYKWFSAMVNIDGTGFTYEVRYTRNSKTDSYNTNPEIYSYYTKVLEDGRVQFVIGKYKHLGTEPWWNEYDLYICTMNPNGSDWTEQLVNVYYSDTDQNFHIAWRTDSRLYWYTWVNYTPPGAYDSKRQIGLAYSNLDGTGFSGFQQLTNINGDAYDPGIYVYNDVIYIFWWNYTDDTDVAQLWLTTVDINITSWNHVLIKEHKYTKNEILTDNYYYYTDDYADYDDTRIFVRGDKIYYTYSEYGYTSEYEEIYDGTSWIVTKDNYEDYWTTFMGYMSLSGDVKQIFDPGVFLAAVKNVQSNNDIFYIGFFNNVYDGYYCTGFFDLVTTMTLTCNPPIILGPNPARCAKPMIVLQAPTPADPVGREAAWLLHHRIQSFSDAETAAKIVEVDSLLNPELFEYSTNQGLSWQPYPATGLPRDKYGALVRARCELGPRQKAWLKAGVGAEDA